jgi:thiamine biosynthesis lipoprotein
LNTVITINLYDKQDEALLQECFDLISKYENIYSRTSEHSELYTLNHGTAPYNGLTYQISDELGDLIKYGLYYSKLSSGAFDISVAPITSLWDFIALNPVLPKEEDILTALSTVNYEYIQLEENNITFTKKDVGLDLGAIAKGYIADRIKELLINNGVHSAMINLGGNVLCIGEKTEGIPFQVGIQKPFADRNEIIAVMEINDLSVVSSGIYERYFTLDGVSYHHILNPKTGYPYDNDLVSVTIISNKSVDGDGLSTTCFALGLDKGLKLIASLPGTYAVFITKDYEIYYSKGFKEAINVFDQ